MMLEFSPNIKFHEIPPSGSWVAPCGRTGRSQKLLYAVLRTRLKPILSMLYREIISVLRSIQNTETYCMGRT